MKGTRRFRHGAWRLQVKSPMGNRYATVHAPDNKAGMKEADAALRKLVDEVERGDAPVTDMTVAELLERWLRIKASTWDANTFDTNRNGARHLLGPLGRKKLATLRAVHIEECYAELAGSLAPASIRRIHGILHAALEQAERWDLIPPGSNPAGRVTPPKVERRRNTTPDPSQMLQLLDAVNAQADLAAFIQLAATTGARRGTVTALRWSNIDFDRGIVTFVNKFTRSSRGLEEKVGSKTGRVYQVSIGLDVNAALRRWRLEQREKAMSVGIPMPDDPLVFTSPRDPRIPRPPMHWSREWRRLTRVVDPNGGLDHIRLHDLKHFAATQLLAGGMPVLQVAERLGMSPTLLMSLYGHSIPAADRELADYMDRLMKPGG